VRQAFNRYSGFAIRFPERRAKKFTMDVLCQLSYNGKNDRIFNDLFPFRRRPV